MTTPARPTPWNPQQPSPMPSHRYRSVFERVEVPLTERTWPDRRFEAAPLWVPVDLRDGNQALAEPMDTERKTKMFDLFLRMGYKEIEVAYPSSSQTDFDFVRSLAARYQEGAIPEDVTISVFTPAKPELIERTFASVEGLPNVLVHLYTATAPAWRDLVLRGSRGEVRALIEDAAELVAKLADQRGPAAGRTRFEFSPEVFNLTEPDYVIEVCDRVTEIWDACADRPVVHNLPATVEVATPNVYADQIEYMSRHLARREHVILSVHPHNDRGTGVACAELAVLAGAQRVEGCLLGNGERTGNVDLVTLGLNLHAQGVDPMVDFSDIDAIRAVVEECNRLPVHIRHPYVGDLVYTAFSGTHQDAISKGMAHHAAQAAELGVPESRAPWDVPYLPIDPADVGRGYKGVIRVNSQSGKGGMAYLLRTHYGVDLPRDFRPGFSEVVQRATDEHGREMSPQDLWELFRTTYVVPGEDGAWKLTEPAFAELADGGHRVAATVVTADGSVIPVSGSGNGPLSALTVAWGKAGIGFDILDYSEHAVSEGADAVAACYLRCRVDGREVWGVGMDTSVLTAMVRATVSALNQALDRGGETGSDQG
ncbi:2-isopropylmalate synthase [Catenulispora sp. GAS73]|uniref:2-isopropylmalate synthase n=1 Tax=Catenulispora sp. GAS73 TaxID=3156269 RepID=UPI00351515E2